MPGRSEPWSYEYHPAAAADAAFIYAVRKAGLRPYVEQVWGWVESYQRTRFCQTFDPARYQVIVVDGQPVGAMSFEWRPSELFLNDIEIVAEWRGQGLGTTILRELVHQAHRRGLPVALQVLRVNPARRLYERIGFRVVAESTTHVQMRTDTLHDSGQPEGRDQ